MNFLNSIKNWFLDFFNISQKPMISDYVKPAKSGYDLYEEGTPEREAYHSGFTYGLKLSRGAWQEKTVYMEQKHFSEKDWELFQIHEDGIEAGLSSGIKLRGL